MIFYSVKSFVSVIQVEKVLYGETEFFLKMKATQPSSFISFLFIPNINLLLHAELLGFPCRVLIHIYFLSILSVFLHLLSGQI